MQLRYAHNTRATSWRGRAGGKRPQTSMLTLPYLGYHLPVVPPPGRVSRQPHRLRSVYPPSFREPLGIVGAMTLQPYASRLVILPVSRGST